MSKALLVGLLGSILFASCKETNQTQQQQNSGKTFEVQAGDILLQKWWKSDFAKAINAVTKGYNNNDFAHVGMVVRQKDSLKVLESTASRGMCLTNLDSFITASTDKDGKPQVAVARLKEDYHQHIDDILTWSETYLGSPYDTLFVYGNDRYYCAELLHDAFNHIVPGGEVFELAPMTFKDPETGEFFPIWVNYFANLNAQIPEGELGLNPGSISRSLKLDIVHEYWNQ